MAADMLKILYLVHDLDDPTVRRRVLMLQAGGAEIALAGFSRRADAVAEIEGISPIDLGRTHNRRFLHRLASVGRAALALSGRLDRNWRPDVIVGRNLEMLALAHRANALLGADIPVVYECLDIHRLMLRADLTGQALRAAERHLMARSALLVTSSPGFVEHYFEPFGQTGLPVFMLENKVLELEGDSRTALPKPPPGSGEPWTIGWFGALRCRTSLDLLSRIARKMGGEVEIVLRGRPAYDQFDDFDRQVGDTPHLRFEGPYRNPEDLADIYGAVHFSWLADFFEAGMNSNWLLPCRLYEGCRHATVPITVEGTQAARRLKAMAIGFTFDEPGEDAVMGCLRNAMDVARYSEATRRVSAADAGEWRVDARGCAALVDRFRTITPPIRQAA